MKCYAGAMILLLTVLPSCFGRKEKIAKSENVSSSDNHTTIDSIYKEQSRKEAAFSSIRKQIDILNDEADILHDVQKLEARCADIPVLVNARPQERYFMQSDRADSCLAYESFLSLDQIADFYQREMERFGWGIVAKFDGLERMLVCKRPGVYAIISLRPSAKKSHAVSIVIHKLYAIDYVV